MSAAATSPMRRRPAQRGLTLVELLVAISILAMLSLLSYTGLSSVLTARERVDESTRRWREIAMFLERFGSDVRFPDNRGHRLADGTWAAPLTAGDAMAAANQGAQLVLIRAGTREHGSQRIGYRFNAGTLELLIWPALDDAPEQAYETHAVLGGVQGVELSFLGRDGNWSERWPSMTRDQGLPAAVAITVLLVEGWRVNRLFALP